MGEDETAPEALKSLQQEFNGLMLSILRRISDGAYFPLRDYFDQIHEQGGVCVARSLLSGDVANPLFTALRDACRHDLMVEFYIDRPPWFLLFSQGERQLAVEHFRSGYSPHQILSPLPFFATKSDAVDVAELERENANSDQDYTWQDCRNLLLRRQHEYAALPPEQQVRQLEVELNDGYPFTPISAHRLALNQSQPLKMECPLVAESFENYDRLHVRAISDSLGQLRIAIDLSESRISKVRDYLVSPDKRHSHTPSSKSATCFEEVLGDVSTLPVIHLGTSPSRDLRGEVGLEIDDLRDLLCYSALGLATQVGEYMAEYAGSYQEENNIWVWSRLGQCRYSILRSFTETLTADDLDLLLFAIQSGVAFRGATYDIPVLEDGLIREVSSVFTLEAFPTTDEYGELCARYSGISWVGLLATVQDAARWHRSQVVAEATPQAEAACTERRSASPLADVEWGTRKTGLLLEDLRRSGRVGAESSLRAALGVQLYESLCPEACTPLKGVESLLRDEDFPDPTLAIMGLALAFENQLKIRVLEPFCEYLRSRGIQTYPEGEHHNQQTLLRYGELERSLTLDKILRALRPDDTEFESYGQPQNLRADRVLRAIRRVRNIRNRAGHEGGFGYEYARNLRREWLDPQRGVFAALTS